MIAELIKIGLIKLFTAILSGGTSLIGPNLAGGTFKTTPGRVPTESATININVNGEMKTASVKTKREVLAAIEEVLELGK
jgi:hypothetical protein